MQKRLCLFILLMILIVSSGFAEPGAYQWEMTARIRSPGQLWQAIKEIEELKPVFLACGERLSELLLGHRLTLPENISVDRPLYVAVGSEHKSYYNRHHVWTESEDGRKIYLGDFFSIIDLLDRYRSSEAKKTPEPGFPDEFASLDADAIFHLRFKTDTAIADLSAAIEREVLRDDKRLEYRCMENLRKLQRQLRKKEISGLPSDNLPECPLKGVYSFDPVAKKFSCSHEIKKLDLEKAKLDRYENSAYALVKMLRGLKQLDVKLDGMASRLVFELEAEGDPGRFLFDVGPAYGVLSWFSGLENLEGFSPSAGSHMVVAPKLSNWLNRLKSGDETFYGPDFAGKKPEEFLPEGPLRLSFFGAFGLYMRNAPPMIVSADISAEKFAALQEVALSQGMPLEARKMEIYGRELEFFAMPTQGHRFNAQEQDEGDERFFVVRENEKRMSICVGEMAAREKLALECGERKPVSPFAGIRGPVKFALAYRADGLGVALLEHVNRTAMQLETRSCNDRMHEWIKANSAAVATLKPGDDVPQELAAVCPRGGIYVAGSNDYDRISCAVHNYRGAREVKLQFLRADVPFGRWLRAYACKDGARHRLVIDFYRPGEVK